jgi:hypothetical protein
MTSHRIIAADHQLQAAQQSRLGAVIVPLVPEPVFNKKRPQDFANWYTFISQTRPSQIMWYEGFSATDTLKFHLRWKEGDRLYLAEQWFLEDSDFQIYLTKASVTPPDDDGWQPAATMPPEAAQYWYEVAGVRVMQCKNLKPIDYVASGSVRGNLSIGETYEECRRFEKSWDTAHPDHTWAADRWVVVLEIKEVGNA